ncbi:putative orfan [Tupanvirus soda lake]|uniref:Orfan n=2 Tax=Tupanvirus TaxID=2094720 RepID=A0AC62AAU2_9VIRU|nr:putative orfan [Tupanvirus soda lake]QKU34819.1 putative orfan [Tupanvirus soda lake]
MTQHKFINFHTGYYDVCENVFVKCPKTDAERFMKILPKLNEFVELLSMNGSSCSLKLSEIDISVCDEINLHNFTDCSFYSEAMKMEYQYEKEESGYIENECKFDELADNKYGLVYKSRCTDIYEVVLQYCILHIVWQILKYNTKFKILNKLTTKICLKSDGQTIKNFVVPNLKCDQWLSEDFFTSSPVDSSDTDLIATINNLYEILEYVKNNENKEKIIIFEGNGDYEPSYIRQNENRAAKKNKQ